LANLYRIYVDNVLFTIGDYCCSTLIPSHRSPSVRRSAAQTVNDKKSSAGPR